MCDICSCPPSQVDELPFLDFLTLAVGIDARRRTRESWAEKAGVWVP